MSGRPTHLERLMARIVWVPAGYSTPCWDPGYARDPNGYCCIKVRPDPVPKKVHRFAYEQLVGPIPDGLVLDHLCRNPWCCNPSHVEPVTQATNILRGVGWAPRYRAQTHCKHGHEFTPENTRRSALGRECKACNTRRARERYRRKKEASNG